MTSDLRTHWEKKYQTGPTPWDTGITPPEVEAFWNTATAPTAGLALDLGCGTGTNALYLAQRGLYVIGMDLAAQALVKARQRLQEQPSQLLRNRVLFLQADVSRLPLDGAGACYVLDIGCFHGIPVAARYDYANSVVANLASGGCYHLYAFDRLPEDEGDPMARGLGHDEIERLFTPQLRIVHVQRARPDRRPCRWYLLQKPTSMPPHIR